MPGFFRYLAPVLLISSVACGGDDDDDDMTVTPTDGGDATDAGSEEDSGPPTCEGGDIPPARGELDGVFDEASNRIVVFGGNVVAPETCIPAYEYTDQVWAFDLECETWSEVDASGPGQRGRHAAALDTMRNRMLIFGGRDTAASGYTNFNDVWAFDLESDSWSEVTTSGDAPSARHNSAAIYDEDNDRLIIFGGNPSEDSLNTFGTDDTFALDLSTNRWTEITSETGPSARYYHAAVEMNGKLYVFAGNEDFFTSLNDLWELDLSSDTWTMVAGGGPSAPTTRFGSTLFADAANDALIMITGHDSTSLGNVNDIWTYDVAGGSWSEVFTGDTIQNAIMTACDPPADFANMDLDAPERRHGNAFAQSATTGYTLFGKTDCGNVNDVWSIDFSDPSWTLVGANSTSGEACERSGNTMCTRLCF